MRKFNKIDEYSMAVADQIISLFRDEDDYSPSYHFDLDKIDLTKFITGMIVGCNLVFNQMSGEEKTT